MFLLNSCLSLFSAACSVAPLLPKLRGHFAEFLNNASPAALGFSPHPPVSVYGTGMGINNSGFFSAAWLTLRYFIAPHHASACHGFAFHVTSFPLAPAFHSRLHAFLHVSPQFCFISYGTGISTCCPSDTSFDLALGPDLPRADQLYSGNLGYSAGRILTFLSLATHSGILSS